MSLHVPLREAWLHCLQLQLRACSSCSSDIGKAETSNVIIKRWRRMLRCQTSRALLTQCLRNIDPNSNLKLCTLKRNSLPIRAWCLPVGVLAVSFFHDIGFVDSNIRASRPSCARGETPQPPSHQLLLSPLAAWLSHKMWAQLNTAQM